MDFEKDGESSQEQSLLYLQVQLLIYGRLFESGLDKPGIYVGYNTILSRLLTELIVVFSESGGRVH